MPGPRSVTCPWLWQYTRGRHVSLQHHLGLGGWQSDSIYSQDWERKCRGTHKGEVGVKPGRKQSKNKWTEANEKGRLGQDSPDPRVRLQTQHPPGPFSELPPWFSRLLLIHRFSLSFRCSRNLGQFQGKLSKHESRSIPCQPEVPPETEEQSSGSWPSQYRLPSHCILVLWPLGHWLETGQSLITANSLCCDLC